MAKRKNVKNKKYYYIITAVIVLILASISYFGESNVWNEASKSATLNSAVTEQEGYFYAHFIDVGQADCTLLKCGDDVVLIDGGEVDSYNTIKSYLDSQNVTEIDYYILTHAHSDHIGSADDIIRNYKIDNVIMTRLSQNNTPTTEVYRSLLSALSESDAKIIAAKPNNEYSLNSFSFKILAPNDDYDELNNTSVVIKAVYQNNSFIFQGDAEKESEDDILDAGFSVKADVIKLGHHGSNTSTSADYLKAVNPKIAVISCGTDNKYNHPHKEIITRLEKNNIEYYRTDLNGTVVVSSDGTNLSVYTAK